MYPKTETSSQCAPKTLQRVQTVRYSSSQYVPSIMIFRRYQGNFDIEGTWIDELGWCEVGQMAKKSRHGCIIRHQCSLHLGTVWKCTGSSSDSDSTTLKAIYC
ncbi:unnamed protein product [Aspergillus oryzae]|uniref:Unnamed protein product n=2 Tax=Aspergillus oryzae TaxID=5062 RepID=A0AAN4Y9W9_ASPOZ|nr:unnamed protein product [Aspergillus oryzae]GMF86004.1 unnamed protein product [Aspergillus oryzae]GMG14205.1 unnamed protein product [Aspergillus oryzae]GMG22618.1 unnamed protein product [Aspergillus oryzae]GMG46893.1 unnamed protein product [Aspergillus oryzae var. brunneus]